VKEKLLSLLKDKMALAIAAAVVIAVVVVVRLCLPVRAEHEISVPSPAASGMSASDSIRRADVTKDTVQAVLQKTLSRAASYSRVYKVTTLWTGGQSESTVSVWKSGDNARINTARGGTVKNVLVSGRQLSVWYDGSNSVFHSALADSGSVQELDEFSRLVTYEGIFDVPADKILDAGYVEHDGQSCIYAKYTAGSLNYVNQIYVSISSGLLVSAEIDDGETPVYRMETVSTDLTEPSASYFTAPT